MISARCRSSFHKNDVAASLFASKIRPQNPQITFLWGFEGFYSLCRGIKTVRLDTPTSLKAPKKRAFVTPFNTPLTNETPTPAI